MTDGQTFLSSDAEAFRTLTMTDLQIPAETIQIAADGRSVTFQEVESAEDPTTLTQQTRVFRTTFQLARAPGGETVVFQIAGVRREGPVVEVTTPARFAEAWHGCGEWLLPPRVHSSKWR